MHPRLQDKEKGKRLCRRSRSRQRKRYHHVQGETSVESAFMPAVPSPPSESHFWWECIRSTEFSSRSHETLIEWIVLNQSKCASNWLSRCVTLQAKRLFYSFSLLQYTCVSRSTSAELIKSRFYVLVYVCMYRMCMNVFSLSVVMWKKCDWTSSSCCYIHVHVL